MRKLGCFPEGNFKRKKVFYSVQEALFSDEKVYRLDLSYQNLNALSTDLTKLRDLQELNISGNLFQEIPTEIFNLSRLQILNVNHNQIYRISGMIVILQNLEELYMVGNPIMEVSYQIQNLPRLQKLELSQNLTFELYHNDNNFQNLTLLSIINNSVSKLTQTDASAETNSPGELKERESNTLEKRMSSSASDKHKPKTNQASVEHKKHLETISGLQKDKNHLEQKVSSLAQDLNQSQSLHERLKKEKDSVLQAKKAILAEKEHLEDQIKYKSFTSTLLFLGGILSLLFILGFLGYYIYKIKNNVGSLRAKLGEQEEELEDNEDIIRQQAHIISEQSQILKNFKNEDKTQNLSF